MNDLSPTYAKLLEAVNLAHDDLTKPIGPALPAPTSSLNPDPTTARDIANKAVTELHEAIIDRINMLRSQLDSAEATVKLALNLVIEHHNRYEELASATLEGVKLIEKAVNEITKQASTNGK